MPATSTKVRNDADLAGLLGISRAAVSAQKARGMPTHSLEDARAWRDANLKANYRKDMNPARELQDGPRKYLELRRDRAAMDAVDRIVPLALEAAKAGRFELVRAELQAALAKVPEHCQARVALPVDLWDALVGPQIDSWGLEHDEKARAAALPDAEFDWPAGVLFALAAGLSVPAEPETETVSGAV